MLFNARRFYWSMGNPQESMVNGPPLLTLKSRESWTEEKMTSKTHLSKNAMRVYAAELLCSTGVSSF